MKATRRSAGILLLLYTILISLWTWRLMPRSAPGQQVVIPQQPREKVAAYLAKMSKGNAMPAMTRLISLQDDELQILSDWVEEPPLKQLRQLTVQHAPILRLGPQWGEILLQTWLNHSQPVNLLDAHLMIAAAGDRLSTMARHTALESLARRAINQGDADDAVAILARASELPGASWDTLQMLAAACRNARHAGPVLRALTLWIHRHRDEESTPEFEQARDLELGLMLDAGLGPEAVALQLSYLTGSPPYSDRSLDRAYLAVRSAHQSSRLLPLLNKHLETFPEHSLPQLRLEQQRVVSPDYRRWLGCRAALCDEEQPRPEAFAAYLRLAAARDPAALHRVCLLASTSTMKIQAEAVLAFALGQKDLQKTVLYLAQTNSLAKKVVDTRLREEPHHRDLHYATTLAAAEANAPHSSVAFLWQDFLRRFPADNEAQRQLVQAHLHDRQPGHALRVSNLLPPDALTEEDLRLKEALKQL